MHSDLPKVLHPLAGRPLIAHVLRTVAELAPDAIRIVYGHGGEALRAALTGESCRWVHQTERLGTGHAVGLALSDVDDTAHVLVLYGDVPLVRADTLRALISTDADPLRLSLLTARLEYPSGYGRILRDANGQVTGIVEERDATQSQRTVNEINTGILAAGAGHLKRWLAQVTNHNAQREYYLTDVVSIAGAEGAPIHTVHAPTNEEILGVNSREDLALLERIVQRRRANALMRRGVTIIDPARVDIRGDIDVGRDCVLDVNVVLEGSITLGDRVTVGPNNVIREASLGDDVTIHPNCVVEHAQIAGGCSIGPFARIRPGALLGREVHVGNFVEIKNSELAQGVKANHLSYVGDSTVGRNTNIGAGVITCNYDGAHKHRTEIGDDVFIGSNCQLVAPVKISDGATVGAGSTIVNDVPAQALAVSRARQRHISRWRRPKKDT